MGNRRCVKVVLLVASSLGSQVSHGFYVSGDLTLRSAYYAYNVEVTATASKAFVAKDCDVLQVVHVGKSGYMSMLSRETNSDLTNAAALKNYSSSARYPDLIEGNGTLFAYALTSSATNKMFQFDSDVAYGSSVVGRGDYFAYCYSTKSTAVVNFWDGQLCAVKRWDVASWSPKTIISREDYCAP